MPGTQVIKASNGSTVTVRTGVIRGAGPQGPMGPVGPAGQRGEPGATGPAGGLNDVYTDLAAAAPVAVAADDWYPVALLIGNHNEVLVPTTDPYGLQWAEDGVFVLALTVRFEQQSGTPEGGVSSGSRKIRFVDSSEAVLDNAEISLAAAPSEPTIALLVTVVVPDPSKRYMLQATSDDITGITVSTRVGKIVRIGSGPKGDQGVQGPVGQMGPQGPQGSPGNAGSGYTTFDASIGGSDSTLDPGGAGLATADQGVPYPSGGQKPATPWFLRALAQFIEPRLVARFASAATRTAKRSSRSAGEVTYLDDSGSLQFREKVGGSDHDVARVVVSSSTPPSGSGQAAPGVIWVQV